MTVRYANKQSFEGNKDLKTEKNTLIMPLTNCGRYFIPSEINKLNSVITNLRIYEKRPHRDFRCGLDAYNIELVI